MKCGHCGKNEASFFQRTNINGSITETHLCHECAEKLGYLDSRGFMARGLFDGFFDEPDNLMSRFFSPFRGGRQQRPGGFPFPPGANPGALPDAPPAPVPAGEDMAADAELSRMRETNILREQMRAAAAAEDYERAISLREEIKRREEVNTMEG
ncbi:MAG: UvrB/UvrC motif-containing protein [Oscillospiraceae bacterium]|jgi:protein arginine kinase activator|nr:UvrB/UvrC motif-containing protein [Oscillospiraceae bacterium]